MIIVSNTTPLLDSHGVWRMIKLFCLKVKALYPNISFPPLSIIFKLIFVRDRASSSQLVIPSFQRLGGIIQLVTQGL